MTNETLRMLETAKTKTNTEFMAWWKLLNGELSKLHHGQQCGFTDAKGCYEMGESPETAAKNLWAVWTA